jgi:hypothetical protein
LSVLTVVVAVAPQGTGATTTTTSLHLYQFLVLLSLWGWAAAERSHPMFCLFGGLLFWFRLFSSCGWDGASEILTHAST